MKLKYSYIFVLSFIFASCSKAIYEQKQEAVEKTSVAADELLEITQSLKEKIEDKVEKNPNSSSGDFIVVVDRKIEEIEDIQEEVEYFSPSRSLNISKKQDKRDFERIRRFQKKLGQLGQEVKAIYTSVDGQLDKTLESDVYFQTGHFYLSHEGKNQLNQLVYQELLQMIEAWNTEDIYQDKPKRLRIKIAGYADLQGSFNIKRRRKSNLILSEKRAESVKNILQKYLLPLKEKYNLELDLASEGKGEEPPPGLQDLTKINNPDRRICTISSYVIPIF